MRNKACRLKINLRLNENPALLVKHDIFDSATLTPFAYRWENSRTKRASGRKIADAEPESTEGLRCGVCDRLPCHSRFTPSACAAGSRLPRGPLLAQAITQ